MGRLMLSAEPLTVGERLPTHSAERRDRGWRAAARSAAPHDFFMEVAVVYALPLSAHFGLELYLAPSGEPALGPTAYPHRISAISDPLAPIGHHWQDSSHITFGVLTAGIFTRQVELEGSWAANPAKTGGIRLARAGFLLRTRELEPSESWKFQASYGYLASPEGLEPDVSSYRATASATYNSRMGLEANWASTFVYGQNIPSEGPSTPSFLLESIGNLDGHHVVFGRAEYVRKVPRIGT